MLASKEKARKAKRFLRILQQSIPMSAYKTEYFFVEEFIDSAIKRLPTEKSYKRDRERRRAKSAT